MSKYIPDLSNETLVEVPGEGLVRNDGKPVPEDTPVETGAGVPEPLSAETLEGMTKEQLQEYADARGIPADQHHQTKPEMLETIREAQ